MWLCRAWSSPAGPNVSRQSREAKQLHIKHSTLAMVEVDKRVMSIFQDFCLDMLTFSGTAKSVCISRPFFSLALQLLLPVLTGGVLYRHNRRKCMFVLYQLTTS